MDDTIVIQEELMGIRSSSATGFSGRVKKRFRWVISLYKKAVQSLEFVPVEYNLLQKMGICFSCYD